MTSSFLRLTCCLPAVLGTAVAIAADEMIVIADGVALAGGEPGVDAFNFVRNQDGHSVQVEVDGGQVVRLIIDGDQIDGQLLRLEDGRIYIRQPDGTEEQLEGVVLNPGVWAGGFDALEKFRFAIPEVAWEQPHVVIGVNMTEPDAALRHHLGLDEGSCTMISGYYKGLPADNAGLERFDVITAVDGKRPAAPKDVRAAIVAKEAGDEITFDVIQRGKSRRVVVRLAAFDANAWRDAEYVGDHGFTFLRKFGPKVQVDIPGVGTDWDDIMVSPDRGDIFRWRREVERDRVRDDRRDADGNMQERLDRLNDRLAEVQRMLDELVKESKGKGR